MHFSYKYIQQLEPIMFEKRCEKCNEIIYRPAKVFLVFYAKTKRKEIQLTDNKDDNQVSHSIRIWYTSVFRLILY